MWFIKKKDNNLKITESKLTDYDKKKAAYALNLCSVSVSQIVDYNDLNILEQEYNAILNNLNLQEIPKDEAFLTILKHLLDTITFFRLEEGDKKFVEKEYQEKMKNAIWSAVPNFGVIIAGALDPISIGVSLASQVGIGYMNYRKAKAVALAEKEKQEWELQRSATEQFNALRRELFNTAWKVAEKYDFPDEYRLTENQIRQYNDILMDSDIIRKYERMETIKDNFGAFPPFWYHFANTANSIAIEYSQRKPDISTIYRDKAKQYFEIFNEINFPLLREDLLASSCLLEYIDLLNPKNDREEIIIAISKARKLAGSELDILQLCAMSYLKIGELKFAEPIFRQLVNEDYNTIVNGQLLSRIYIANYLDNNDERNLLEYRTKYDLLCTRVNPRYLLPLPNKLCNNSDIEKEFITNQQIILEKKVDIIIDSFMEKYAIIFNKVIPTPDEKREYPDSFFSDDEKSIEERDSILKNALFSKKNKLLFFSKLSNIDFCFEWIEILNSMIDSLRAIEAYINIKDCSHLITDAINSKKDELTDLSSKFTDEKNYDLVKESELSYRKIFSDISFSYLTADLKKYLKEDINNYIKTSLSKMEDYSNFETDIRTWCLSENLPEPEVLFDSLGLKNEEKRMQLWLDTSYIFGSDFTKKLNDKKVAKDTEKEIIDLIIKEGPSIIKDLNKVKILYKLKGHELSRYFMHELNGLFANKKLKKFEGETIAILDDQSFADKDLLFTKKGIVVAHSKVHYEIDYDKIEWNHDGKSLLIGSYKYFNSLLDMERFYDLIIELAKIV